MPIFEFVCGDCGRQFEEIMTFAEMEAGQVQCPDCGAKRVERSLSGFATGSSGGGGGGAPCGGGGFT